MMDGESLRKVLAAYKDAAEANHRARTIAARLEARAVAAPDEPSFRLGVRLAQRRLMREQMRLAAAVRPLTDDQTRQYAAWLAPDDPD